MDEVGGALSGAGGALRGGSELGTSKDPALTGGGEAIGTGGGGALSPRRGEVKTPATGLYVYGLNLEPTRDWHGRDSA